MKNYIQTIKYIDEIIGPQLVNILPTRSGRLKTPVQKLLVIRPGGMGDAALLAPVLSMLKLRYPTIRMEILCECRNSGVFQALSFVDAVFMYENPIHMLKVMKTSYDIIVDTEQYHYLSAVACRLSRGAYTMGYEACGRGRMFDHAEEYDHEVYEADMFLKLFRHGFDLPQHIDWTSDCFKPMGISQRKTIKSLQVLEKKLVCLFPGATIDERLWPEDRWASVIDYLYDQGFQPLLLGASLEKTQCLGIQNACHSGNVINLCGKMSLLETAWLFKRSEFLISTDSGILHLGVICNLPTISLFGSGIIKKWAPKGKNHRIVSLDLLCSPCTKYGYTPPCPNEKLCMMGIKTETVIDAIKSLCQLDKESSQVL